MLKLYAIIVKYDQYFQKYQLITKITFIFVLGIGSDVFNCSTSEKIEIYHIKNEEEK